MPTRNYLGTPATVDRLLADLFTGTVIDLSHAETDEQILMVLRGLTGDCESVADILLGGLPQDYPPAIGWSEPGGIDRSLKKRFPQITETDPMRIVAEACEMYLREAIHKVAMFNGTGNSATVNDAVSAIRNRWLSIFLGKGRAALH